MSYLNGLPVILRYHLYATRNDKHAWNETGFGICDGKKLDPIPAGMDMLREKRYVTIQSQRE
jgi:hypothetical protein